MIHAATLHHGAHLRVVATGMVDSTSSASSLVHSLHACAGAHHVVTSHHVLALCALHPGRLHEGAVLCTASLVLHVHHRLLEVHIARETGAAWVLQARHGTLHAVQARHVGQLAMVVTTYLRDQHTVR